MPTTRITAIDRRLPLRRAAALAVTAVAVALATGCPGAPEKCSGCLSAAADAGPDRPGASGGAGESPAGSGGGIVSGTGGGAVIASGGSPGIATGGSGTGGSNGGTGSGGSGTGGIIIPSATGGNGGAGGGGLATGGAATGGAATGGAASGGAGTGGAGTGGVATGGVGTGGAGTGGRGTGGAGTGGAAGDADLVLWYKFDESSGATTAGDSAMAEGLARNGTLATTGAGTATFSTTRQVGTHALSLVGNGSTAGGYVALPSLQTLAPTAISLSSWVNLAANTSAQNWERVFDFGVNTTFFMFLTARSADAPNAVRFVISTSGTSNEQRISSTAALSAGAWHHLVVVLAAGTPYTGTLYIDGVQAATNSAMTLHPGDIGATIANYIGRSEFSPDAYFSGYIDDFRVYRRALTAAEVMALFLLR